MALLALVILAGFCCTSSAFGQTSEKQNEKLIIRQDEYTYKVPCVQDARTATFVIERDNKASEKKNKLTGQTGPNLYRPNSIIAVHYFPFDSSRITINDAEKILQSIPPAARQHGLKVTGYACAIGSVQYNQKLSQQRAQAIATLLSRHGYKIVSISGAGEVDNSSTLARLNRRVVVQVQ